MDVKKRPVRPAAARAQNVFNNGSGSEEDEEMYGGPRPVQRNARRVTKVDLSRLNYDTLQRYRARFGLKSMPATKDELMNEVAKHFASASVDEEETILRFAQAVHRGGAARVAANGGLKPKGRPLPMKPKGR